LSTVSRKKRHFFLAEMAGKIGDLIWGTKGGWGEGLRFFGLGNLLADD
jgi:hypothetical protein